MKIPPTLSTVHVDVDVDGRLAIALDGEPRATSTSSTRGDLRTVLNNITTELGTAVRVEVREHDGTTYSDITTPPGSPPDLPLCAPSADRSAPASGLNGAGFHPGEDVAVAYVICTQTAGSNGETSMRLPPALLARPGPIMLLIGMTSATVVEVERP